MKDIELKRLVRKNILSLEPYSTARDECSGQPDIFLDANESPYGNGWNRYPDPRQRELKAKLAEIKGIETERLFLGNGSDEAIDLMFRIFCTPGVDNAIAITPSYGMYKVAAAINDIEIREVLLDRDFGLPVNRLIEAADDRSKLMFICSPNNPSGNAFCTEDILRLATEFNGILVIDEAYADFSTTGSINRKVQDFPNVVILQTLSKAWGMAGLRLGIAIADPFITELMSRVKYPYNIGSATLKEASEALGHPIGMQVSEIITERERLARELSASPIIEKVYPSEANFLLVKTRDADSLYSSLLNDGIIVRKRGNLPLCDECLRITVGLKKENDRLLKSLEDYEKGNIH